MLAKNWGAIGRRIGVYKGNSTGHASFQLRPAWMSHPSVRSRSLSIRKVEKNRRSEIVEREKPNTVTDGGGQSAERPRVKPHLLGGDPMFPQTHSPRTVPRKTEAEQREIKNPAPVKAAGPIKKWFARPSRGTSKFPGKEGKYRPKQRRASDKGAAIFSKRSGISADGLGPNVEPPGLHSISTGNKGQRSNPPASSYWGALPEAAQALPHWATY